MHRIEIPEWALRKARNKVDSVDPGRTALLVIDMQNGFTIGPPIPNAHALAIIPNVNRLAAGLRAAGGLVVMIQHTICDDPRFRLSAWEKRLSPPDPAGGYLLETGKPAHALHPDLVVERDDLRIEKHRFSAFLPNSSDLDVILKERGIDTLIVSGTVTNVCCECTARDGYMLGYRILFLTDGTAAQSDMEHNATLLSMTTVFASVMDTSAALAMVENGAAARRSGA